jgi:hypothetical protein
MIPKVDKDDTIIEEARGFQGVCWGEEYERMISGMLYVVSYSFWRPLTNVRASRV